MSHRQKFRFVFVSVPFSGIEVFFRKLECLYATRQDIECHWIWIEEEPADWVARIPPYSMNWTLKASAVAKRRIRLLEDLHGPFDGALFNNIMPANLLGEFGRRVPFGISMDCTPQLLRNEPYNRWFLYGKAPRVGFVGRLAKSITKKTYARATFLLPYSSVPRCSLIEDYGVDEKKIDIVPVGVDVDMWNRNSNPIIKKDKEPGRFSILFIGGDFERKGCDIVLRSAQRPEFLDCDFHILTRKELSGFPRNVYVHKDIPPNSPELLLCYLAADVFVMPTRAEFPQTNAVLEAMAMELPVITSSLPGFENVVTHNETGFIGPPEDEEIFNRQLLSLKGNPELRKQMGANGRRKVENEFNLSRIGDRILGHLVRAAQTIRESNHNKR